MSPDLSPIYTPQQTQGNLVAHLAQIQHQLQADSQPSSAKKGLQEPMIPVQQQLQSLSQMVGWFFVYSRLDRGELDEDFFSSRLVLARKY